MKRSRTGDDVFIGAPPESVFRALDSLGRDHSWWPGARIGSAGAEIKAHLRAPGSSVRRVRFVARAERVRPGDGLVWRIVQGEVEGTAEWWLEPFEAGTIAHLYLDVVPGSRGKLRRWHTRVQRHRKAIRAGMNALKDRLERAGAISHV